MYGTVGGSLLLCFLSGAVFSLPYFFEFCFPMTYVGLFCLFLLLESVPLERKQFRGLFCFFLGFTVPLCSWFADMYPLPFFDLPTHMALIAVAFCCVVVPAKLSLQYALLLWLSKFLPKHPLAKAFGVGALWAIAEWTLQFGVLAFPWGTMAMSQTGCLPILQTVSLFGTEWVAFLMVSMCALSAYAFVRCKKALLIAGTSICAGALALGGVLLFVSGLGDAQTVRGAILQGNISTEEKWDNESTVKIYETYLAMAKEAAEAGAEVLLLPETAIPVEFAAGGVLQKAFGEIASTYDCTVVMGIFREADGQHNSVVAISPDGTVSAMYDKQHPVPFGEYMPYGDFLGNLFPSLASLNPEGALTVSDTDAVIESKDYRIGCFVCFDSAFDGFSQARENGDFLAVVTNDAWFGDGVGPEQHLRQAKLRAAESGRAVLRAGNTGISAIVDRTGQVLCRADTDKQIILYGELPIYSDRTLFSYIGDSFLLLCAGYLIAWFGWSFYAINIPP